MRKVKKISRIIFWVLLLIITIYSTLIIIQRLFWKNKTPSFFEYKNFIVLTGSMKPTINSGDIVIVKEINNVKDIKENDIISFKIKGSVVTHRVKEVYKEKGEYYFITKGDANSGTDTELINKKDLEGKYCFKIPFLGNIILFLQKPIGIIFIFIVLIIFLILSSKIKK